METPAPANVRVLVRIRPLNNTEHRRNGRYNKSEAISIDSNSSLTLAMSGSNSETRRDRSSSSALEKKSFKFDAVLGPRSSQADVYSNVKEIVEAVANGYNGTIVAYGQTGSGKTHTVFGSGSSGSDSIGAGLVHRSLRELFNSITMYKAQAIHDSMIHNEDSMIITDQDNAGDTSSPSVIFQTEVSFIEIYNEKVYDLLSDDKSSLESNLPVRENEGSVYVEGLRSVDVANTAEAEALLNQGLKNRKFAATAMNRTSSRSHAVLFLSVTSVSTSADGIKRVRKSRFTLVDLAGSERQKTTGTTGARLKEASMINKSLLCLGYVINALADREDGGREKHIPFRDSKLTFLLRDSWGGNSKTCLVATVSPSILSIGETLSTLNFAKRAKLIRNTAFLNENTTGGSLVALKEEVTRLRDELRLRDEQCQQPSTYPQNSQTFLFPDNLNMSNQSEIFDSSFQEMHPSYGDEQYMHLYFSEKKISTSLKRKVDEEKWMRKSKQARIDYLNKKRKLNCDEDTEELDAVINEMDSLQRQLDRPSSSAMEWQRKHDRVMAQLEAIRNSVDPDSAEARIVTLQNQKNQLEELIQREIEEKTTLSGVQSTIGILEKENVLLKQQIHEIQSKVDNSSNEKIILEKELSEKQEEIDVLFEEIDRLEKIKTHENTELSRLQENVKPLQTEKNILVKQNHEIKTTLEILSQEKMALEKSLFESKEEIDILIEEIGSFQKLVEPIILGEQHIDSNNVASDKDILIAELSAKIKIDQEEKNFLKSEVKSLEEQNSRLTDQASTLEEECFKYQEENRKELKERETHSEVVTKLTEEKEIVEGQLQSMSDLQKECEKHNESFIEEINSYTNIMQKHQLKFDNHDEQINKYEEQINKYEEQIDNYEKIINTFEKNRSNGDKFEKDLLSSKSNKGLQEEIYPMTQHLENEVSHNVLKDNDESDEEQIEINKVSSEVMEQISCAMIENFYVNALADKSKIKSLSDENRFISDKLISSNNYLNDCKKELIRVSNERNNTRVEIEFLHREIMLLKNAREKDEILHVHHEVTEQNLASISAKYNDLKKEVNQFKPRKEHDEQQKTIKELLDDNQRYADKLNLLQNILREKDVLSGNLEFLIENSEVREVCIGLLEKEIVGMVDQNHMLENSEIREVYIGLMEKEITDLIGHNYTLKACLEKCEKGISSMTEENYRKVENMKQSYEAAASILHQEKLNLKEIVRQLQEEKIESIEEKEIEFEVRIKELMDDNQRYTEKLHLAKNNTANVTKERDALINQVNSLNSKGKRLDNEFIKVQNLNMNSKRLKSAKKEEKVTQIYNDDDFLDEDMFLPNGSEVDCTSIIKTPSKKMIVQNSLTVKAMDKENTRPESLASSTKKMRIRSALKSALSTKEIRTPLKNTSINRL